MEKYDLAVIGGGPAGYTAAARAAEAGLRVVLFEERALGGVCLNEGCIPTKTLLYCAKMYEHATGSAKMGVVVPQAEIDFAKMMERKTRTVRRLVGGIKARMRAAGVNVVEGRAVISSCGVPGETVSFGISCNNVDYNASRLLLCTGSSSIVPPFPGRESAGDAIVTNREILSLEKQPGSLVIIGGGVIGMEFASFFNSIGTGVTVIEMMPKILGPMDAEISGMLQKQYERKGVEFHLNCKVTGLEGNTVVYSDPDGGECRVVGEKILVSVGRRADFSGLEVLRLECGRGVVVDSRMRTSVKGVWAAGDITGSSMLAHTAVREAEVAVNDMLGVEDEMNYDAVPGVVYTNPEVAGVGLTEEQAGPDAEIRKLSMNFSGRYMAENDNDGICKIISREGRICGVQMLGNPCSELIALASLAVSKRMTADDFSRVIFPHPTVSEIFRETLLSV